MRLAVEIAGVVRTLQVTGAHRDLRVVIDGQDHSVDAVEIEPGRWSLLIAPGGRSIEARVRTGRPGAWVVLLNGASIPVTMHDGGRARSRTAAAVGAAEGPSRIVAPMPGKVVRVLASAGDRVTARQAVVVMEAMKMENELRAPRDGTVLEVFVREGASVEAGAPLFTIA